MHIYRCICRCLRYNPKALRTATSEVVLLPGQKEPGTHVVVVFWAVIYVLSTCARLRCIY